MRSLHPYDTEAVEQELLRIADWWQDTMKDEQFGGFIGEVDYFGQPQSGCTKSAILNARILWFFSQAAIHTGRQDYRQSAQRAYQYWMEYFHDPLHGGSVWEVDAQGALVSGKKQTYAVAFGIYALSTFYKLTQHAPALETAKAYFLLIEQHCWDDQYQGYIEALDQQWAPLEDVRLSDKDLNTPKSMNTHLHVLEAYTSLYDASEDEQVRLSLLRLVDLYVDKIVDSQVGHLRLFFAMDWQDQSTSYSYGHDIESSWLLWEALEVLNDDQRLLDYRDLVVQLADTALQEGIGEHGQLCDEFDRHTSERHQQSIWWGQAEAMVGFENAYLLTGEVRYRQAAEKIWQVIQQHHIDEKHGDWHWLALVPAQRAEQEVKAGFWKCPYHNGRAMMEIHRLLSMQVAI